MEYAADLFFEHYDIFCVFRKTLFSLPRVYTHDSRSVRLYAEQNASISMLTCSYFAVDVCHGLNLSSRSLSLNKKQN